MFCGTPLKTKTCQMQKETFLWPYRRRKSYASIHGSKILLVGINFFEEIQSPKVSLGDFTMIMYFSHYLGLELSVVQP